MPENSPFFGRWRKRINGQMANHARFTWKMTVLRTRRCGLVTDRVAWPVGLSVGWSVTVVSPAKTAEPIEMPFGLWTPVDARKHVLQGIQIPMPRAIFTGKDMGHVRRHYRELQLCKNG